MLHVRTFLMSTPPGVVGLRTSQPRHTGLVCSLSPPPHGISAFNNLLASKAKTRITPASRSPVRGTTTGLVRSHTALGAYVLLVPGAFLFLSMDRRKGRA